MKIGSIERVRMALAAADHEDTIFAFPEGTRMALDAANAARCDVSQIVKSLVFKCGDQPVLVLTSGSNRVDESKVEELLGSKLEAAKSRWVRDVTGFAIGGVSPIAHKSPLKIFIDEDLMKLSVLWAAAGSPTHVFSTKPDKLLEMTGGKVADVKVD